MREMYITQILVCSKLVCATLVCEIKNYEMYMRKNNCMRPKILYVRNVYALRFVCDNCVET